MRGRRLRVYKKAIVEWFPAEEDADRRTRNRILSGDAAAIIREFEAAHSLARRPGLRRLVAEVGGAMACAFERHSWDVGFLARHIVLGTSENVVVLGVGIADYSLMTPGQEELAQDVLKRAFEEREDAPGAPPPLPRLLRFAWWEPGSAVTVYNRFGCMMTPGGDANDCYSDLVECLRDAGSRSLRLRDFVWANVYLKWCAEDTKINANTVPIDPSLLQRRYRTPSIGIVASLAWYASLKASRGNQLLGGEQDMYSQFCVIFCLGYLL